MVHFRLQKNGFRRRVACGGTVTMDNDANKEGRARPNPWQFISAVMLWLSGVVMGWVIWGGNG